MKITFDIDDKRLVEALNRAKLDDEPTLTLADIRKIDSKLAVSLSDAASWMVIDSLETGNDEGATTSLVMSLLGYNTEE